MRFIELASTIQTKEEILQAKVMLEGAANLRPRLLQVLLEACGSIKAKRLFLWLARSVDHPWYRHVDISEVNWVQETSNCTRGTLDTQFMITFQREAWDGQQDSLF